jgi:hypothetical protein
VKTTGKRWEAESVLVDHWAGILGPAS